MLENQFCRKLNGGSVSKAELLDKYTPDYSFSRKRWLFEQACAVHSKVSGDLEISRWAFDESVFEKGAGFYSGCKISSVPGYYDYKDRSSSERYVWYVNFADYLLFGFYDDSKFAQDEIQSLEHPLLCSVVRYLDDNNLPHLPTYTALIRNKVTAPYLVENVPYWISVNTSVTMADGSVHNLYGHNFSTESHDVINAGIKIVQEDLNNNIIAMAAPDSINNGCYSYSDIRYSIETVLTAFSAAAVQADKKGCKKVVIHTGNWGCGAFGGVPVFSYLCQFIAGSMCGIDELVFHAPVMQDFNKALALFEDFKSQVVKVPSLKSIITFLSK